MSSSNSNSPKAKAFLVLCVVLSLCHNFSSSFSTSSVGSTRRIWGSQYAHRGAILHMSTTTPTTRSPSMSEMSSQMKDMRAQINAEIAKDERASLMMDALRGKGQNEDSFQRAGLDMKVISMDDIEGSVLPTEYDPVKLEAFFSKRPGAVLSRVFQIVSTGGGLAVKTAFDLLKGDPDTDVKRAAELRDTIVSLGPFFIKLGQALSIRPDILSPRAMVELQQLCDKVPTFDSQLAMQTIRDDLGKDPNELFTEITDEPIAAASLGQVYRATLKDTGEEVAVKVQRPFVLETVSLDLHLARQLGLFLRNFPQFVSRLDIVSILDEFAGNFYQELDYNLECRNGIKIAEDMRVLPMVVIPKNYPEYTSRRVHVAQWVDGEKLSQSQADDVGALVNLGVITYLTQLLDTGFFHADPHPGNMMRTPDGKLVILDFGLMTKVTDDQKYGMIDAIAHLIHRDYSEIGNDFVKLDFIPEGVDTKPIVPALSRVFEAALAGGGAKSINFQELAADLAEITFKFPFRIPPYFALVIRAISVLEGIALVGNPEFAIVDEAFPYISKRLLTDDSPRLRAAFRYMVYGRGDSFDVVRMIDMLQALEKFVAVKDKGDGSAFKQEGMRGNTFVGKAGDSVGTQVLKENTAIGYAGSRFELNANRNDNDNNNNDDNNKAENEVTREALKFFFSDDGAVLREFVLDEISAGVDALSRDALRELVTRLGVRQSGVTRFISPSQKAFFKTLAPKLSEKDRNVVDSLEQLVVFFTSSEQGGSQDGLGLSILTRGNNGNILQTMTSTNAEGRLARGRAVELLRVLREYAPSMQSFGLAVAARLVEKATSRLLRASSDAVFGVQRTDTSSSIAAAAGTSR